MLLLNDMQNKFPHFIIQSYAGLQSLSLSFSYDGLFHNNMFGEYNCGLLNLATSSLPMPFSLYINALILNLVINFRVRSSPGLV
jgi:hypothetical protein